MGLIEYYVLFAFSTSITACYLWFWPLLQKARSQNITNSFTGYPVLSTLIYIFISAFIAPILIMPLLSNNMAEKFEHGLSKEILKQD
jgi:preprotein translocase subunit SecG